MMRNSRNLRHTFWPIPVFGALPHGRRHGDRLVDGHVNRLARRLVGDLLDVAADGVELEEARDVEDEGEC